MAPKRKAPISGTTPVSRASAAKPTSGKPPAGEGKKQQQQSKKRGGGAGQSAAGPSKPKKARVEVEFEGGEQPAAGASAAESSAKGKGKGKGPAATAAPPAATAAVDADAVPSTTANSKGKKLAFADSADEPSTSVTSAAPKRVVPTGPKTFQVVAGSYEKLLYGLQGVMPSASTPVAERDYSMKPIFIFPAHQACVKTVAASEGGKWLATGSSDEVVKIWDLRRRKEVGGLQQHTGAFSSLCDRLCPLTDILATRSVRLHYLSSLSFSYAPHHGLGGLDRHPLPDARLERAALLQGSHRPRQLGQRPPDRQACALARQGPDDEDVGPDEGQGRRQRQARQG